MQPGVAAAGAAGALDAAADVRWHSFIHFILRIRGPEVARVLGVLCERARASCRRQRRAAARVPGACNCLQHSRLLSARASRPPPGVCAASRVPRAAPACRCRLPRRAARAAAWERVARRLQLSSCRLGGPRRACCSSSSSLRSTCGLRCEPGAAAGAHTCSNLLTPAHTAAQTCLKPAKPAHTYLLRKLHAFWPRIARRRRYSCSA